MTMPRILVPALAASALLAACTAEAPQPSAGPAPEQEAFWASLQAHCGNAYAGRVSDATEYYRGSVAGDAVMHFMECSDDRIHIPFHLGENRSRNWIVDGAMGDHRGEAVGSFNSKVAPPCWSRPS